MSRSYEMSVDVEGYNTSKDSSIIEALRKEWEFEPYILEGGLISATNTGYLCGGELEEEFTDRIAIAVWKANGGPCDVSVGATFLEDLPCENHSRDKEDYEKLMSPTKDQT